MTIIFYHLHTVFEIVSSVPIHSIPDGTTQIQLQCRPVCRQVRKKQKKIDSETLSIVNAEVRLRANEKKKGHDLEYNDDIVTVQQEIDDTVFAVQDLFRIAH
jgi:hypothetical protein